MVCAELLCGGVFGILASITIAIVAIALIVFSIKKFWNACKKRIDDPVLQGTPESMVMQNARYIVVASQSGLSDEQITQDMLTAGWKMEDVTAAFTMTQTN